MPCVVRQRAAETGPHGVRIVNATSEGAPHTMTWVKFDDQFPEHRKVAPLSDKGFRLHVTAIHWCARNTTDGHIEAHELRDVMPRLRTPRKIAEELVQRGLWEKTTSGWVIHDYLEYQPSAEQIRTERDARKARQERWRGKKRGEGDASRDASRDASPDASRDASRDATPPRPGPTRPSPTGKGRGAGEVRHLRAVPTVSVASQAEPTPAAPTGPPRHPYAPTPEDAAQRARGKALAMAVIAAGRDESKATYTGETRAPRDRRTTPCQEATS